VIVVIGLNFLVITSLVKIIIVGIWVYVRNNENEKQKYHTVGKGSI